MTLTRMGNGAASMSVREDGVFEGVLRLRDADQPFRGTITVLGPKLMRYGGDFGEGRVIVDEEHGARMLRMVPDGGGGGATFTPAQ